MEPDSARKHNNILTNSGSSNNNNNNNSSIGMNGNSETKNKEVKLPGKAIDGNQHGSSAFQSSHNTTTGAIGGSSIGGNGNIGSTIRSTTAEHSSFSMNKSSMSGSGGSGSGFGFNDKTSSFTASHGIGERPSSLSSQHYGSGNFGDGGAHSGANIDSHKTGSSLNFGFGSSIPHSTASSFGGSAGLGSESNKPKSTETMGRDSSHQKSSLLSSNSSATGKPSIGSTGISSSMDASHGLSSSSSAFKSGSSSNNNNNIKTEEKSKFGDYTFSSTAAATTLKGMEDKSKSSHIGTGFGSSTKQETGFGDTKAFQTSSFPSTAAASSSSFTNDTFKTMQHSTRPDAGSSTIKNHGAMEGATSMTNNKPSTTTFSTTKTEQKRPSIDEGWINVDKSELEKPHQQHSNSSSSSHKETQKSLSSLSDKKESAAIKGATSNSTEKIIDEKKKGTNGAITTNNNGRSTDTVKEKEAAKKESKPKKDSEKKPPAAKRERAASTGVEGGIRTSGRVRRPVEVVYPVDAPSSHHATSSQLVIQKGHGSAFSSISHISDYLSKKKSSDKTVMLAHRLLYGRVGEAAKRKANLRLFHGFDNTFNDKAFEEKLKKLGNEELGNLAHFLNLERSGGKNVIADRIVDFLKKPVDLGVSKSAPPKATAAKKRKAETKKKSKTPSKKSKTMNKAAASKNIKKREGIKHTKNEDEQLTSPNADDEAEEPQQPLM